MRYMMLIYSTEDENASPEAMREVAMKHGVVMSDAAQKGVFRGAEPLEPSSTATTVRVQDGKILITDGPFVETKEQLAGYYILDCRDLDEALEWASRIPTSCQGASGHIEVRPIREIPQPPTHG